MEKSFPTKLDDKSADQQIYPIGAPGELFSIQAPGASLEAKDSQVILPGARLDVAISGFNAST